MTEQELSEGSAVVVEGEPGRECVSIPGNRCLSADLCEDGVVITLSDVGGRLGSLLYGRYTALEFFRTVVKAIQGRLSVTVPKEGVVFTSDGVDHDLSAWPCEDASDFWCVESFSVDQGEIAYIPTDRLAAWCRSVLAVIELEGETQPTEEPA